MKLFQTIIFIILISKQISAQCDIQTNNREDGVTVKYLRPERIGFSDKLLLALSMQTADEQYFVCTLSIFEKESIKLKGDLIIKFTNNNSSTLELSNSILTTFNNYPATISIYMADSNDLINILSANISMVSLQLQNNIFQVVVAKKNADILKKQYSCLR